MKRRSKAGGESANVRRSTDEAGEIARLSRELSEALERQTATSQVLQVISSFAGELDPVFQAILANATRLCEGKFGVMQLLERNGFRAVAFHDVPPAYAEAMRRDPVFHPKVGHPLRRVVETKQVVHAVDARTEEKMRGRMLNSPVRALCSSFRC